MSLAFGPFYTSLRVSKHLLLHCANVTFLLVQSRVFFFVGIPSPYLLAAPDPQALSKVLLFALPPLSTPAETWLHSVQPTALTESSLTGTVVTPTGMC